MSRNLFLISLATLFLTACATTPEVNEELVAAEERLDSVENDENVQRYAAADVDDARIAVERAASTWQEDGNTERFRHHLYIAQRSLDIAEAQAAVEHIERDARQLSQERDRLRLEARVSRAEVAEMAARAQAAESSAEAEAAAAVARQERRERQIAMSERERAEQERRQAEQRRREAELEAQAARQDAERAREQLAELRDQFAELEAEQTERGLLLTLRDVLFDFNEADLKSGAERQMAELASYLKTYSDRPIRIEGFTDSVGSDEYNQTLSERRAASVEAALVQNGVNEDRIDALGYGEAYPVAGNDTDTGRAQNRRVEIIISYDDQPVEGRDDG